MISASDADVCAMSKKEIKYVLATQNNKRKLTSHMLLSSDEIIYIKKAKRGERKKRKRK